MPAVELPDADLERLLGSLLTELNRLPAEELRSLRHVPLDCDRSVQVSYLREERTAFGYEFVELELRRPAAFEINLRVEGVVGALSTVTHLPVVRVTGDAAAARAWLADANPKG
jgi:hypothetical protein